MGFAVSELGSQSSVMDGRPKKRLKILGVELVRSTSLQRNEWELIGYSIC